MCAHVPHAQACTGKDNVSPLSTNTSVLELIGNLTVVPGNAYLSYTSITWMPKDIVLKGSKTKEGCTLRQTKILPHIGGHLEAVPRRSTGASAEHKGLRPGPDLTCFHPES